jgi:hypothetical protein
MPYALSYNLDTMIGNIDMLNPNSHLRNQLNLNKIVGTNSNEPDNTPFPLSPYFDHDSLITHLKKQDGSLKILSLNCQSLNAKIDEIKILLHELINHNISLDILCLQETWFEDSPLPPLITLEGYNTVSLPKHASEHGGLLMYIKESMSFDILSLPKIQTMGTPIH